MSLLERHLDQIELCSSTISELPFPRPKIFTNAMLHNHDITALIRDTEDHERALFSLAPDGDTRGSSAVPEASSRRVTAFSAPDNANNPAHFTAPRKGTAVAAVLGGDLSERIRREYRRDPHLQGDRRQEKDTLDVELLLRGAEKLCGVYPLPGALERIAILRNRNAKVTASMEQYEDLVAQQSQELGQMNKSSSFGMEDEDVGHAPTGSSTTADVKMTEEDLQREEEGIVELEKRKHLLEERVTGMEKDLGGLLR